MIQRDFHLAASIKLKFEKFEKFKSEDREINLDLNFVGDFFLISGGYKLENKAL